MNDLMKKLGEAIGFIRTKSPLIPDCGIVLGSGLGTLVNEMNIETEIPYKEIPHFPVSTVAGHSGKLLLGKWQGKKIVVMQGRFHYYEGYSLQQVTFPIRVIALLGAHTILITNATGGLNPEMRIGDLMVVNDHINLNSENPLRGENDEKLGSRFPDQHAVYDKELISKALEIAERNNIRCHTGIYVGVTGPTFETPAEYRYMRIIGGDAVGMSTVPEVIVANHMGLRIFCISVICDEGNPPAPVSVSHEEVVKAAQEAEPKVAGILKEILKMI
jgi:purine-nucleoside phosphorylase